jgi:hypothetical protein
MTMTKALPTIILAGFAVCAASWLGISAAHAADAAYTGTWSADLAKCKVPQDQTEAPMIVTKNGYDQHEAHCTFKSVKEAGKGEWKVSGSCSVEGDRQAMDETFTVSGNTLSIGGEGASQDLLRCP